MKRLAKIGWAVASLAVIISICAVCVACYLLIDFAQGTRLAQEGYAALAAADYDTAIARFGAALQKNIGKYQRSYVYMNRGSALNSEWRLEEAIRDFSEALRLNPKLDYIYAGRGWAYQQRGELELAMADLSEAIQRDPNSSSAYYGRGLIFYGKKEMDRAIADFDEAVRCSPDYADGFIMRGLCYAAKNDLDPALANFDAAIMIDPKNARAFTERGRLYERQGKIERSMHDFAEATRLSPPLLAAISTKQKPRISNPLEQSAHLDVKPLPRLEIKQRPGVGRIYSELIAQALSASAAGEFDRAVDLNNAALAMDIRPDQASRAMMNRGNAYRGKQDWDKALRDYDEAIILDSRNAGAYVNRASVLSHNGDHEGAIKDCNEALRFNPKQWEAYFNRAADFREEGRLDEALVDLQKVMELNPSFVGAYVNRAAIHLRKSEIDNAITDYDKAIEIDPNSVAALTGRAMAYIRKKQSSVAERDIEKIEQLDPKQLDAALNSLAWFRATCPDGALRDGKKATSAARQACELSQWKNWRYIDTLAAACAEAGDFDEAVKYQDQALQLSQEASDNVQGARQRLQLYQKHKPYRDEPIR